jgi:hypothetical protein
MSKTGCVVERNSRHGALQGTGNGFAPRDDLEVSNKHRRAQHQRDADGDDEEKEFSHRNS